MSKVTKDIDAFRDGDFSGSKPGLGSKVQKFLQNLSDKYPAPDKKTRMNKYDKQ